MPYNFELFSNYEIICIKLNCYHYFFQKNYGQKIIKDVKKILEENELKDQLSTFTQVQEMYNVLKLNQIK